jgi:hypothetical protein
VRVHNIMHVRTTLTPWRELHGCKILLILFMISKRTICNETAVHVSLWPFLMYECSDIVCFYMVCMYMYIIVVIPHSASHHDHHILMSLLLPFH